MHPEQASLVAYAPLKRRLILGLAGAVALQARAIWASPLPALPLAVVDLPPWVLHDADQNRAGILIDLARQLEQSSGQALTKLAVPYKRGLTMLESGQAALMFAYDTSSLNQIADAIGALGSDDIVLLGRQGQRFSARTDLRGRVVGHIRGATYDADIVADKTIIKYETSSYAQSICMLLRGRLDAVVAPRIPLRYAMQKMGIGSDQFGPALTLRKTTLSLYQSHRHALSTQRPLLAQASRILHSRDALGQLIDQYLSTA